eukprot:gene5917-biopygen17783
MGIRAKFHAISCCCFCRPPPRTRDPGAQMIRREEGLAETSSKSYFTLPFYDRYAGAPEGCRKGPAVTDIHRRRTMFGSLGRGGFRSPAVEGLEGLPQDARANRVMVSLELLLSGELTELRVSGELMELCVSDELTELWVSGELTELWVSGELTELWV